MSGILYLIPIDLGSDAPGVQLPAPTRERLLMLTHFVAEEPRTARRFLAALGRGGLRELAIETLNEHTPAEALHGLLNPLRAGHDVGLVSEAGCPAVADPGADLVALAHREGIRVVPMVGPSSLLLALMASGLGGQRFSFHGYLPAEGQARRLALAEIEGESARQGSTQLFIETPYRNDAMLQDILAVCNAQTLVCAATDLTQSEEAVRTLTVAQWRAAPPHLGKRPTVFGLRAAARISADPARPRGNPSRPPTGSRRNGGRGVRRNSDEA